jgi:hypothetical protein
VEKFGIDNLKKLVVFPMELGNIAGSIIEDQEKGFFKWFKIVYVLLEIIKLLRIDWSMIKEEYLDLSDAEREEIRQVVKDKFDIKENDELERKIEASFDLLLDLEKVIRGSIELFNNKEFKVMCV